MQNFAGVYTARLDATAIQSGAGHTGTVIQINATGTATLEILRIWFTVDSEVNTVIEVRLTRRSGAGTGTAFTAEPTRDSTAFGGTVTTLHTVEGAISETLMRQYVNILNGFLYLPLPDEQITIPQNGRFAIDLPTVPASLTVNAGILFGRKQ